MSNSIKNWIASCVFKYFYVGDHIFVDYSTGLKITIKRNNQFSHFIEFSDGKKTSIISGNWCMKRDEMISVLEKCYEQDLKKQDPNKFKKIYDWICSCVYMLDGVERRYFINEDENFMLDIYKHNLSDNKFDYWITTKDMNKKSYLNIEVGIAEDLIGKIYSSYLEDFCNHKNIANDIEHYKNKVNTLTLQLEEAQRKILSLEEKLQTSNYDRTSIGARIVFAQHILSGNREDRVKEFYEKNKKYVDDLSLYNGVFNIE